MTVDALMAEVDALLPGAVLVDDLSNSSRVHVARIAHAHTTYIAKRPVLADAFESELAALRTLPASVRPELIAHGDSVVVMEDLGTGGSLADLLLGNDAGRLGWCSVPATRARTTTASSPTGQSSCSTSKVRRGATRRRRPRIAVRRFAPVGVSPVCQTA